MFGTFTLSCDLSGFFVPNVLNHQTVGHLNLITNTPGERMFSLHFTKEGLGTREELRQNLTLW